MPLPSGFRVIDPSIYWAYDVWCSLPELKTIHSSATDFINKFVKENCFIIEGPSIIIRISDIVEGWCASVHAIVTGHQAYRYLEELGQIADEVVKTFKLCRLEADVPTSFRGVNRLLEKCGFEHEATLRNAGKYGTIIEDLNIWRWPNGRHIRA